MNTCDACGESFDHPPLKAERNGEEFGFCRDCDGYKTLRVPTADWVIAQRQRRDEGRQWGEQIVRPKDGTRGADFSATAEITPTLDDEALAAVREQVESVAWGDFPTADVKEAVRDVLRDELPEGALR